MGNSNFPWFLKCRGWELLVYLWYYLAAGERSACLMRLQVIGSFQREVPWYDFGCLYNHYVAIEHGLYHAGHVSDKEREFTKPFWKPIKPWLMRLKMNSASVILIKFHVMSKPYGQYFTHGIGRGVGEYPRKSHTSAKTSKEKRFKQGWSNRWARYLYRRSLVLDRRWPLDHRNRLWSLDPCS